METDGSLNSDKGGLKRAILRGVFGSMGLRLIQAILGFMISILMAKGLGPTGVGTYGSVVAALMILNIPVEAGVSRLVMRRTAVYDADQDYEAIRGLTVWSSRVTLGTSALVSLLLVAVGFIDHSYLDAETRKIMFIAAPTVPILAFASLHAGYLRGLRKVVLSQIAEPIRNLILMTLMVALIVTVGTVSIEATLLAFSLSSLVSMIVLAIFSRISSPKEIHSSAASLSSKAWFMGSLPFLLIGGIGTLSGKVDVLLLGTMSGMNATGHFLIATQFAVLVLFGLTAVTMTAAPHFTRLHRQGDTEKLALLAMRSSQASVAFAAFIALILLLAGPLILTRVYGEEFFSSYPILMILMLAYIVQASTGASGPLLSSTGYEGKTLNATVAALVVKISTCLLLIPLFGAIGAALGILASLVCVNFLLWHHCRRELGIETFFLTPVLRRIITQIT